MPGKFWERTRAGNIEGFVKARGQMSTSPNDLALAGQLDEDIDRMLDDALELLEQRSTTGGPSPTAGESAFLKWWSVGASMRDANIREHPALNGEEPEFLDEVLLNKFQTGVRSDGVGSQRWAGLRPDDRGDDRRRSRDGSSHGYDHWAMCAWLAEQTYEDAREVFGASIRNVWQMLDRPTLRPLVLRNALLVVLRGLPEDVATQLTSTTGFPEMMKALVRRWPGRGRRSALQPVHYDEAELVSELRHLISAGLEA